MRACFLTALASYPSFCFGCLLFDAMQPPFSRFVCDMGVPQKLLSATRPFVSGLRIENNPGRDFFALPRLEASTARQPRGISLNGFLFSLAI